MKKTLNKFLSSWKAETPIIWKWVRNVAGNLIWIIPILDGISTKYPSLQVPTWFTDYGWYLAGVSLLITGYAGTRQKKGVSNEE